MKGSDARFSTGWCETHQKKLYPNRKAARYIARQHKGEHKNTYPCDALEGYWHVGGLDEDVIAGHVSRREHYWWSNSA